MHGMTGKEEQMRRMSVGDSPKLLGSALLGIQVQVVPLDASMQEVAQACRHAASPTSALPLGAEGELVAIGTQIARGYVGRPDLSAAKFGVVAGEGDEVRFYRSGDVVRMSEKGLVYVGRTDTQVKILGMRCELGEIESVLRARCSLCFPYTHSCICIHDCCMHLPRLTADRQCASTRGRSNSECAHENAHGGLHHAGARGSWYGTRQARPGP